VIGMMGGRGSGGWPYGLVNPVDEDGGRENRRGGSLRRGAPDAVGRYGQATSAMTRRERRLKNVRDGVTIEDFFGVQESEICRQRLEHRQKDHPLY
jgi:hypothetical protein